MTQSKVESSSLLILLSYDRACQCVRKIIELIDIRNFKEVYIILV